MPQVIRYDLSKLILSKHCSVNKLQYNTQHFLNLLLCRPDALDVRGIVVDDDPLGVDDVLRGSD